MWIRQATRAFKWAQLGYNAAWKLARKHIEKAFLFAPIVMTFATEPDSTTEEKWRRTNFKTFWLKLSASLMVCQQFSSQSSDEWLHYKVVNCEGWTLEIPP